MKSLSKSNLPASTNNLSSTNNPSKLPVSQQAWLWALHLNGAFGLVPDRRSLNALERKGLIGTSWGEWGPKVWLTDTGKAEAARITAWRDAECERLTAEEKARR